MRVRRSLIALWTALVGLTATGSVTAATGGGGLLAPTVCLSPAVFIVLVLTPAETIVDVVGAKIGLDRSGS